uniref:Uncharacterized protein n=1 Tax=Trichuris muris TaxID=70415 RepID=A0A5S6QEE8_TRIMR
MMPMGNFGRHSRSPPPSRRRDACGSSPPSMPKQAFVCARTGLELPSACMCAQLMGSCSMIGSVRLLL